MDNLRLVLMIIAVLVFGVIFLWSKRPEKPGRVASGKRPGPQHEPVLSELDDDDFIDPVVENFSFGHDRDTGENTDEIVEQPMMINDPEDDVLPGTQHSFLFSEDDDENPETADIFKNAEEGQDDISNSRAEKVSNDIILLIGLMSQDEQGFSGADALTALRDVGLEHGEMDIFHHYGVGQSADKEPLFSLANMFEPGKFDPLMLEQSLHTKGFVIFMRADGQRDDRVSLELMLNTAERLATLLNAQLLDRSRQPLSEETIDAMRAQLTHV